MILLESAFAIPQTLQYHDVLNPALWDSDGNMRPDVRSALLGVAKNFIDTLTPTITSDMIQDICLTGSNANYNYTRGSDCDIHIMLQYPDKIYDDFAQAKKTVWNNQFKVSIHGFPAEIYPQDVTEKIVTGSGWFSISKNQWIQKPVHQTDVDVTNPTITQVASKIGKQIDFVLRYNVTDLKTLHRLGEKVWGLRDQSKNGEFSVNNLAFKELRNAGLTDKFIQHMQTIQSKSLSL